MRLPHRIVIVGAGITGLMLAALLSQSRRRDAFEITVVDAADRPAFSLHSDIALRVSAIATGSAALFARVGAWPAVAAARVSPYESMRVWDASEPPDGDATLRFDAAEFAVPQLGFIVENVLLQHALLEVLDKADVRLRFAQPIASLQPVGQRFVLEFADGDGIDAELVVGADGARSFVRAAAAIETREWPYEQAAFVTHLQPERPHAATAWQRFTASGPLGMLPLADGRISVVWSTTPGAAQAAMEASDEALGERLARASDFVLGGLRPAGLRGSFPLCARHAERYTMPGLALIGDAAHAIHPLAGQGANLGLQDAASLAAAIGEAVAAGLCPGDLPALRRYERARKGANATMLHFMTGLNRLFTTDSVAAGKLRTTGMRMFNRSGPIKERAVKVALGVG